MRIFACSDIHLRIDRVEKSLEASRGADVAVCLGDITVYSRGLENMLSFLRRINDNVLIIPGNNESPSILEEKAAEMGLTFLHGRIIEFKGFTFAGIGGSLRTPFNTPFEIGEEDYRRILSGFRGLGNLILLSHSPPFNTSLDLTLFGEHVGSVELRRFIEEESPLICLCGHVHERAGYSELLEVTRIVNPGPGGMILEV
ncbi:MAG: metallophosphoesterase family protein [Thermoproteota archaeon]